MEYCKKCGKEIKKSDKFCINCGEKIVHEEHEIKEEQITITTGTKILEFLKGIGTIFLFIIFQLIGEILFGTFAESSNKVVSTLAELGSYSIVVIGMSLVYYKTLKKDFKNFKKEYVSTAMKNWVIGLAVMYAINIVLVMLSGGLAANEESNREILLSSPISNILYMVFMGPLVEELTFRASFKKAFTKWYTFAAVTGFIFGFVHIIAAIPDIIDGDWIQLLYIFSYGALGFFFGKAYFETDNIFTSFIAHMTHNAMCILLILLF